MDAHVTFMSKLCNHLLAGSRRRRRRRQGPVTMNRDGSKVCGSWKNSGLWWMLPNSGITFHPLGIRNPATKTNPSSVRSQSEE